MRGASVILLLFLLAARAYNGELATDHIHAPLVDTFTHVQAFDKLFDQVADHLVDDLFARVFTTSVGDISRRALDSTALSKAGNSSGWEGSRRNSTGKLIVVSNRLPFSVKHTDTGYEFKQSSGGLVSAMLGVMDESMTWIGWPGIAVEDEKNRSTIRAELAEHRCVPVFLDPVTADVYYNGFCNSVLWPLFHYFQDVLDTDMGDLHARWEAYMRANEAFLAEILPKVSPGDTVWVHDYHLMLLPTMLKSRMPSLRVGWFLHTPFPSSEIFRMLPMRKQLMKGLLGADLLGFHTQPYLRHFMSAAQNTLKSDLCISSFSVSSISCRIPRVITSEEELTPRGESSAHSSEGLTEQADDESTADAAGMEVPSPHRFAHTVHLTALPIGIQPERFLDELKKGQTQDEIKKLQDRFGGRDLMLGVDRLDPIKGLPHKLLAFEQLLERHPEYVNKVVLVQIAVPSRLDVALTQQLQQRLHLLVGRINGRFGSLGQMPIHYLDQSVPFSEMVALYAFSSAMVVTSMRDGMNLVAFEWTACQQHKKQGVLILSEFAGAAEYLDDGCIMVNPHDISALAEAMHEALSMPLAQRQELHRNAYDYVTKSTAAAWGAKFVTTLNHLDAGLLPDATANMNGILSLLKQHPRLLLCTSYDGTLTPIVSDPDNAILSNEMRQQLRRLARVMPVAVVSGRSVAKINSFVGLLNIWVAGENGFDIAGPDGSGIEHRQSEQYQGALHAAAAELRLTLAAVPGSFIEENDFAVSVHYRNVTEEEVGAVFSVVDSVLEEQPYLQRFSGKMVVELRPKLEWNKGNAVEFILSHVEKEAGSSVFPIYIGDDDSDADALALLRKRGGLGIIVTEGGIVSREETPAAYKLRSTREVLRFLSCLANARANAQASDTQIPILTPRATDRWY